MKSIEKQATAAVSYATATNLNSTLLNRTKNRAVGSSILLVGVGLLLASSPVSTAAMSTKAPPSFADVSISGNTNRRIPTLRSIASSLSSFSDYDIDEDGQQSDVVMGNAMLERTEGMEKRAKSEHPLTSEELMDIRNSLENVLPEDSTIDLHAMVKLLQSVAHLSHKDWSRTSVNADEFARVLQLEDLPELPLAKRPKLDDSVAANAGDDTMSASTMSTSASRAQARQMLERILQEGNWDGAAYHAAMERPTDQKPWAVLVTGVNGIRKTTSIYQPWFPQLLSEALVPPSQTTEQSPTSFPLDTLPVGGNSFFRQLDHMIATLCNEDFMMLYALTAQKVKQWQEEEGKEEEGKDETGIPKFIVQKYSNLKAAIFTRYRTLSELLGASLLKQAQRLDSNCMMETSGKDVAMFHYVDHFFEASRYNKLALHFTINDLTCAQKSVDERMVREIQTGMKAIERQNVFDIINANAGGPYGSEVLPGIQKESDEVWDNVVMKDGTVGGDWYKATIAIQAHPTEPWTACAVRPDGSMGTTFTFCR